MELLSPEEISSVTILINMLPGISTVFKDDSLCIEKKDGVWRTYAVDRGNIFDLKTFDSVYEACKDILVRSSSSDEEEQELFDYFAEMMKNVGFEVDLNDLTKEK